MNEDIKEIEGNMNKIERLLRNDVKKKAQISVVLNNYIVDLKEIKSVLLNIKELNRQNEQYVAVFNNCFTTFKSNQRDKSKKSSIQKLKKMEKFCIKPLSLAQKERYGKIEVMNLMKAALKHRNTYFVNVANCLEQNNELSTVAYGKDVMLREEIHMQSIRLEYSRLENIKKTMNIRKNQWQDDMEVLLGKDLPLATGNAPEEA